MRQTKRFRSLVRASEPAVEPVSLADAKQHLRVDTDDDNLYITALISSAREWCETYIDRTFVETQWTMRMDFFPFEIELPRPPMHPSLTATVVTYTRDDGTVETLSTAAYRVDRNSTPGVIRNLYGGSWPSHLLDENSVTVTWWAGYGPDGQKVPRAIRHAILMLVAYLYERRLAADSVPANEIPFGVKSLLDTHRWGQYA